jgi:hypothetical protein
MDFFHSQLVSRAKASLIAAAQSTTLICFQATSSPDLHLPIGLICSSNAALEARVQHIKKYK